MKPWNKKRVGIGFCYKMRKQETLIPNFGMFHYTNNTIKDHFAKSSNLDFNSEHYSLFVYFTAEIIPTLLNYYKKVDKHVGAIIGNFCVDVK